MTTTRTLLSLAEDYLAERRALGFDLRIPGDQITAFARFVDATGHTGPLTTRITLDWVQGQARHAKPLTWARSHPEHGKTTKVVCLPARRARVRQDNKPRPITCAWISAAPSKIFRMRASQKTRLISYS